jgi:hypothetical protein
MWSIASQWRDSSGLHGSGQKERERQVSEEGEIVLQIVRHHSNVFGCWIWETYRRSGSSVCQSGVKEKVEPTDHGSILESRGSFLLCARDH